MGGYFRQSYDEKGPKKEHACITKYAWTRMCDYDLNLCRYLNPELTQMGDFGSLHVYFFQSVILLYVELCFRQ